MTYTPAELAEACLRLEESRRTIVRDALYAVQEVLVRWKDGLLTEDEALRHVALFVVPVTNLHRVQPPVTDAEIAQDRAQVAQDARLDQSFTRMANARFRRHYGLSGAAIDMLRQYGTLGALAGIDPVAFREHVQTRFSPVQAEPIVEEVWTKLGPVLERLEGVTFGWCKPYRGPAGDDFDSEDDED